MTAPFQQQETRTWDPDSRIGEATNSLDSRRKRDIWFFVGILIFAVLLFFVWQQRQSLTLADEIARLEARRESLKALVLENWSTTARLKQPDHLLEVGLAADLGGRQLAEHSFVLVAREGGERDVKPAAEAWLAGLGLEIPEAAAAGRR